MSFSLGDETIFSSATEDWINSIIPDDLEAGTYNLGFGTGDETQFYAENADDLRKLWKDFCKENGLKSACIEYCEEAADMDYEDAINILESLSKKYSLTTREELAINRIVYSGYYTK